MYTLLKALGLLGAPRDVQQEAIDAWLAGHEPTSSMRASLVRGEWVQLEDLPPTSEPRRERRWVVWVAGVAITAVCLVGIWAISTGAMICGPDYRGWMRPCLPDTPQVTEPGP